MNIYVCIYIYIWIYINYVIIIYKYFESIDSEHLCHLSAVDENPLAGSMRVRGLATGDSSSLLCLLLLIQRKHAFIMRLNII